MRLMDCTTVSDVCQEYFCFWGLQTANTVDLWREVHYYRNVCLGGLKMKKLYLYETHCHTNEASACACNSGAEMARAYKAGGYSGIMVTNHFVHGNNCIDPSLPWEQWVRAFCRGYENAKEEGDKIGLSVFFGWESNFRATEFLIYGLDKQWLIAHPEIRDVSVEQQYHLVKKSGGMVVHAHPFRIVPGIVEGVRLYPEFVDAVETHNASHSNPHCHKPQSRPEFDTKAVEYARQHDLPQTAGSDNHDTNMLGGGIAFEKPLITVHDYIDAIKNRRPYVLQDGSGKSFTTNQREPQGNL